MNTQPIVAAPKEIRLRKAHKLLEILWQDGHRSFLSCLVLRKSCACSNCQKAQQTGRLSLIDAEVGIERMEVSGVSGLQFHFSDGHFRGLYPWGYLRELADCYGLGESA
ncbi:gamma-butyrobetaine hydroxylase-like domain-containing protein [Stutzerimonas tarimensis]|uniref:Gamma-butyrobetaine hydroxylase-like domain-containing protein n=1 Tax=Stutzerimonas tarimensis TaxID=1507735 RepID=A0ABV7T349_9GAMM